MQGNDINFGKEPGDALYLPHEMPHAVFNLDDTVALTENYLFKGWHNLKKKLKESYHGRTTTPRYVH